GEGSYAVVTDVSAFPAEGGQAVFEPGTAYEEAFAYGSVDAEANRLVDLDRSAPIAHPAGAFVTAVSSATPAPTPTAAPSPGAEETEAEEPEAAEPAEPSEAAAGEESSAEVILDPCEMVFDRTCLEVVTDTVGENPCDAFSGTGRTCDELVDELTGDPCGLLFGKTCLDWIMEDVVGENPCDAFSGTGRTCDELVQDVANDPCGTLLGNTCLGWIVDVIGENPCDAFSGTGRTCDELVQDLANDPCGTLVSTDCISYLLLLVDWAAETVGNASDPCPAMTVEECTGVPEVNLDPEDLVIDGVHNSLTDDGDCSIGVAPPQKIQESATGAYYVMSYGEANCPKYDDVEVTTCLQIKTPDGWKRKNCTSGTEFGQYDAAATLGPCAAKTHKYRTKFTWLAFYITGAVDDPGADDAPSSGTRKVPLNGTKITCPP
ncbi:MAG TPA: hypothetical protein VEV43_14285, partial [Actinomycetota bacterium]|nr:hypothetical protein [Actinomycetota bacterium]